MKGPFTRFTIRTKKEKYMNSATPQMPIAETAESSMTRKTRILFIKIINMSFVQQDLRILKSEFDVRVADFTKDRRDLMGRLAVLINTVKDLFWTDFVFSWFANTHSMFLFFLAKMFRKKSILVAGGYDVASVPEIGYGLTISHTGALVAKLALIHADKVLAVSEFNKKETLKLTNSKKVALVYNAVDCSRFKPRGQKADDLVITVSEVSWLNIKKKGLETFVKTATYLPRTRFTLIGQPLDNSIQYLKKISPPNVVFTSKYVPFQELLKWCQKAKVYCQLSYHESFGVSLAEAMACGCIPVTTKNAALPELAGQVGFYVPYGDPEATARAISEALTSDKQSWARERIQKLFDIENRKTMLTRTIARRI